MTAHNFLFMPVINSKIFIRISDKFSFKFFFALCASPPTPQTYIVPSRDIMNNKVFYQHPNLMRALGMHETVMEVMVNVLGGGESKVKENL